MPMSMTKKCISALSVCLLLGGGKTQVVAAQLNNSNPTPAPLPSITIESTEDQEEIATCLKCFGYMEETKTSFQPPANAVNKSYCAMDDGCSSGAECEGTQCTDDNLTMSRCVKIATDCESIVETYRRIKHLMTIIIVAVVIGLAVCSIIGVVIAICCCGVVCCVLNRQPVPPQSQQQMAGMPGQTYPPGQNPQDGQYPQQHQQYPPAGGEVAGGASYPVAQPVQPPQHTHYPPQPAQTGYSV